MLLVEGSGPVPRCDAPRDSRRSPGGRAVPVTAEQVSDAVLRGSWVVDVREHGAHTRRHLAATRAGWLVPWGDDILLLTDTPEVSGEALRRLAGLGIEGWERTAEPGPQTRPSSGLGRHLGVSA